MQRVAVVDTGLCNVDSMSRAIEECGAKADVTCDPRDLEVADKIVLPGVGAFPEAMAALHSHGLVAALQEQVVAQQVPILGVCLGMQLLATRGTEVRDTLGLDLIPGDVVKLDNTGSSERVPHVGWNAVDECSSKSTYTSLLSGVPAGADFYFVHSFHMRCVDKADVLATTQYCGGFASIVGREHVFGTQFHPEKSQVHGLRLLRNFLEF